MDSTYRSLGILLLLSLLAVSNLTGCGGSDGNSQFDRPGQVSNPGDDEVGADETEGFANVKAYIENTPVSEFLVPCAADTTRENACLLSDLPLLGMDHEQPTVDDVMKRVAVSHDWMAENFRAALEILPAQMLTLLKGVTVVVIDDDIRPSYFHPYSGAIYLDSAYLWTTVEHKADITRKEDFRSGFASELQFVSLGRYVKNNNYAYPFFSLDDDSERSIELMSRNLARLLFHELAHANDFFVPARVSELSRNQTIAQAFESLYDDSTSITLDARYPLNSQEWKDLGQVMFQGEKANFVQQNYSAGDVGAFFASDGASDDYAYSTVFEDTAMLFEETMMAYHFGYERDIAFTVLPEGENVSCPDYLVKWGSRGRIGEDWVRQRAQYVTEGLLPNADLSAFFGSLPQPKAMAVDVDWCRNINLGQQRNQMQASEVFSPISADIKGAVEQVQHVKRLQRSALTK